MNSFAANLFKALGDPLRLRILRAVQSAELSVAELVTALHVPQSTMSRHLKPLRQEGLLSIRREGTTVYHSRGPAFDDGLLAELLERRLEELDGLGEDQAAVNRVLEERKRRSRAFFDQVAGRYAHCETPGGGWQALCWAMAAGFEGRQVIDLGAGEGLVSLLLASQGARVTAVDQAPRMLEHIRQAAGQAGLGDRVKTVEGDLEHVPLPDRSADAVLLSQSLHHAAQPERALSECSRLLRPAGMLLMLDLQRHGEEWMREERADQWLGFEPGDMRRMLAAAGLTVDVLEQTPGAGPGLLLARAHKPDQVGTAVSAVRLAEARADTQTESYAEMKCETAARRTGDTP